MQSLPVMMAAGSYLIRVRQATGSMEPILRVDIVAPIDQSHPLSTYIAVTLFVSFNKTIGPTFGGGACPTLVGANAPH